MYHSLYLLHHPEPIALGLAGMEAITISDRDSDLGEITSTLRFLTDASGAVKMRELTSVWN